MTARDEPIRILRWLDHPDRIAAKQDIERIFFAAAGSREFASDAARAEFRERWLGRYLTHDPAMTFVAVDPSGGVVGYVVGSLDDPARTARFADIPYFAELAHLTARYPAHLHINLDESARNRGTGGRLVEAFTAEVRAAGLPGVHVVTGRGMRNVSFYERLEFVERGSASYNGRPVVLLGRDAVRPLSTA